MKRKNATAAVTLIAALVTVVALYFSYGTTETATPLPSAEQQKQVSDLKKQITVLEERVNELEARLAEPAKRGPLPLK